MAFVSNLSLAFSSIASLHADRVALHYPATGEDVSYSELAALADRYAAALWSRGVRSGHVVAMFHDKSPVAYATLLACLRLGAIYTNLDPDSPWERVKKIVNSCQPKLVVNAFPHLPFGEELGSLAGLQTLNLRADAAADVSMHLPDVRELSGGAPAYIMFTSGSTGAPKGAVMSHANLLWFTQWSRDRFAITPQDVLTGVNPIYFDNSVFDFYSAIFAGATLVPLAPEQVRDARMLVSLVDKARCTIWFSVPSLLVYLLTMRSIGKSNFPAMRKIIFGGEGFPKPKLKQLFELFGERADLENVYGPTECTCICSARIINATDFDDMQSLAPLGRMAQNFGFEILPQDVTDPDFGELFLRGPQVGLGYFRDIARTSKSFVQNPRHMDYADIGYRTGDLVQRDTQGELHFKGRVDFQIKHMGYRIELEEIEAALNTLDVVKECAVIYQRMGEGMGQILGFVAPKMPVDSGTLLAQVAAIVPPYMVPRRIVCMEVLPKNANGKIDRTALQGLATSKLP